MEEMKKSTGLLKNFNTYGFSKKDEIHLIYLPYVKKNIFLHTKLILWQIINLQLKE